MDVVEAYTAARNALNGEEVKAEPSVLDAADRGPNIAETLSHLSNDELWDFMSAQLAKKQRLNRVGSIVRRVLFDQLKHDGATTWGPLERGQ